MLPPSLKLWRTGSGGMLGASGALTLDPSPIGWERGTEAAGKMKTRGPPLLDPLPRRRRGKKGWRNGLLDEFVEEGVFAVVGGPDGEVAGPGEAGLSGLPEEFGVGVLGKFVQADIAP